MKAVWCLKISAVALLFSANGLYAENNGVLGSTSKASATITLFIPAYVSQNKIKRFDFNYDEPYQMTSFFNGRYTVLRSCSGKNSCTPTPAGKNKIIIFEPI